MPGTGSKSELEETADQVVLSITTGPTEAMEIAQLSESVEGEENLTENDNGEVQTTSPVECTDFIRSNSNLCNRMQDEVVYEILKNSSVRGRHKLFGNDGFSYTMRKVRNSGAIVWRCSVRNKVECHATIVQETGGTFTPGPTPHCHFPDPNKYNLVRLNKALKEQALKHRSESASKLSRRVLEMCLPDMPEESSGPTSVECLAVKVRRFRREAHQKSICSTVPSGVVRQHKKSKLHTVHSRHEKRTVSMGEDNSAPMFFPSTPTNSISALRNSESSAKMNPDDFVLVYIPKTQFQNMFEQGVPKMSLSSTSTNGTTSVETPIPAQYQRHEDNRFPNPSQNKKDPVDLFFDSIAAEVKELPRTVRSNLKLEILSLVNSTIQNIGNT